MEHLNARNIATFVGALAFIAVIAIGYNSRQAQLAFNQGQDLVAMAQGLQDAYSNQSYQYGAAVISPTILINSSAVDSTIVSGGNTINSRWQTPIVITGATTTFSAALTAIPYNICTKLMLNNSLAQYITAIGITGGSMNTPPVLPATAATACGASGSVNLTIDFIGHP